MIDDQSKAEGSPCQQDHYRLSESGLGLLSHLCLAPRTESFHFSVPSGSLRLGLLMLICYTRDAVSFAVQVFAFCVGIQIILDDHKI